jgi:hypothetical protein
LNKYKRRKKTQNITNRFWIYLIDVEVKLVKLRASWPLHLVHNSHKYLEENQDEMKEIDRFLL